MNHAWDLLTQAGTWTLKRRRLSAHAPPYLCFWLPLLVTPVKAEARGRPEPGVAGSGGPQGVRGLAWRRATEEEERLPSTRPLGSRRGRAGADVPPLAGGAGCHFTGHPRRQRKGQDAGAGDCGQQGQEKPPGGDCGAKPSRRGDRGQSGRWTPGSRPASGGGAAAGARGALHPRGAATPLRPRRRPAPPLTRRKVLVPSSKTSDSSAAAAAAGPLRSARGRVGGSSGRCPPAPGTPAAAPRRPGARPSA